MPMGRQRTACVCQPPLLAKHSLGGGGLRLRVPARDQVAVAVHVVHARRGGPELGLAHPGRGERGALARVGALPLVGEHDVGRVRRVLEQVVGLVRLALLDLADLLPDGDHGVDEAVNLVLGLRLRGLDHERAGHGPRHGGRVEAVVHQALGHVLRLDARAVLERAQVNDELVRARAGRAHKQHGIVAPQLLGHVVGLEDGVLGRLLEARAAHHGDVRVRDGQDKGRAKGAGRHGAKRLGVLGLLGQRAGGHHGVRGQEGRQVRLDADGAHAGAAAAVRDAERLVQVEVAHVGADDAGRGQPHLRVHVGAVHVHLAAVLVDDAADLVHPLLVHSVSGGVGDHERGKVLGVLLRLGTQLVDVDVAVRVGGHGHDLHARHDGGRGVGAVSRHGDDAHVAVRVPVGEVVAADGHEARVLAAGARVGLQRHGVKARDGAQLHGQVLEHLHVPLRLVGGHEGVQVGELGPRDGRHLARGVELHGARAQRDHGVSQRQVLVLQPLQVAQHVVLVVVRVEHGVREEGGGARKGAHARLHRGRQRGGGEGRGLAAVEHLEQRVHVGQRGGLVDGDAHGLGVHHAQVHAVLLRGLGHLGGVTHRDGHGVEEGRGGGAVAQLLGARRQHAREAVDTRRDGLEALGAVVHRVQRRHVGQQRLRGADVGGRLVAADVLLARLHRHAQRGLALRVDGHADDAAGHHALVLVVARQKRGVRAAVAQRHAKALRGANHDVGAPLAGGRQAGERQQVSGHAHLDVGGVRLGHQALVVGDGAVSGGGLQQHAAHVLAVAERRLVHHHRLQPQPLRARLAHRDGLGVALAGDEELGLLAARHGGAHGHGLSGGGRLVQQRRVGDGHAREVTHHGLEVEQRLQAALRNLRLVGRVLRVPAGVLQHIAQDDTRDVGVVVPHADVALVHLVLGGHGLEVVQELALSHALGVLAHLHAILATNRSGHRRIDQGAEAREASSSDHLLDLSIGATVVPGHEVVAGLKGLDRDVANTAGSKGGVGQLGGSAKHRPHGCAAEQACSTVHALDVIQHDLPHSL
mmetsp:Transcript_26413/g.67196  ORF Transcript_26413/g.67196 Transcript_26413/m.67196 type:complete len:1036 (+) Transcript_26413:699-3806(+)